MAKSKYRPHEIDETHLWLEHGIHVPSRRIRLMGAIDDEMTERIVSGMEILLWQSKEPITMYLDTGGGDEQAGLAIYNVLARSPAPLTIHVVGAAQSMGAVILQAASHRVMASSASVMIHAGSKAYEVDHAENIRRTMLHDKSLDEMCDLILLKRMQTVDPTLTLGKLRDLQMFDLFYSAEEAIAAGLADEVAK